MHYICSQTGNLEDKLMSLPSFLEAFSCIVMELEQVGSGEFEKGFMKHPVVGVPMIDGVWDGEQTLEHESCCGVSYLSVCLSACMSVCMYVCMHADRQTEMQSRQSACLSVCFSVCISVCLHPFLYVLEL